MISLGPSRSQLICSLFLYISLFLSSLPFLHLSSRLSAFFLPPLYLTLDIPLISLSISQYHLLLSPLSISPLIYSSACLSLPLSLHPLLYLALCIIIYPLQFSRLSLFSFSISISFISFSTSPFTTISLCLTSVLSHSHWHSIFSLSLSHLSVQSTCDSYSRPVFLSPSARTSNPFYALSHRLSRPRTLSCTFTSPSSFPFCNLSHSLSLLSARFLSTLSTLLSISFTLSLRTHLTLALLLSALSNLHLFPLYLSAFCSHTALPSVTLFYLSNSIFIISHSRSALSVPIAPSEPPCITPSPFSLHLTGTPPYPYLIYPHTPSAFLLYL